MKGINRAKSGTHHRRATYLGLVLIITLMLIGGMFWLFQAPSLLAKPAPDAFIPDAQTQTNGSQAMAVSSSFITDTRYVATSGDDVGNDCTDMALPCASIQRAVDQVVAGGAVLVASGVYIDVVTHTEGLTTYTQTVYISKSVSIQGGYSTADNFTTVQPIVNAVTINGENMHRAVYIEAGETVTLTGLFVANGLATNTGDPLYGGGLYNAGSNLTISSTWIISSAAQYGAGLYHADGNLSLYNTVVADNHNPNTQKGGGGGLYIANGAAVVESSTFVANSANVSTTLLLPAGDGGAIYQMAGSLDLYNNIFAHNAADVGSAVFISNTATISRDFNLYDSNLPAPPTTFLTGTNSLSGTADFIDGFYHIGPNSAAKDAGSSDVLAVDFELEPRPLPTNGLFDIGADERVQLPDFVFVPLTQTAVIDPNATASYTHWLTNTGEVADSYEFSLNSQSVPLGGGWNYSLSPTNTAVLTTGESVSVTLVVTAGPIGGYLDISNITATSLGFGLAKSVTDTTTISSTPGVLIEPPRAGSGSPNDLVIYTHTLTNTGTGIDQFTVRVAGATPAGWPVTVAPTQTGILQPLESVEVMVWVSIPPGVPVNITHEVTIEAASATPGATDLVTDTTTVEGGYGISLVPDHNMSIPGPTTVVYTHTLTNIGNISDTVTITATGTPLVPSWTVSVTPTAVTLDPLESATISVTVDVPLSATIGVSHVTVVTATMTSSPTVQATAYNTTTIEIAPGVLITPAAQMVITAAGSLVAYDHEIINTGNVSDTFVLTATSTQGWLTGFTGGPLPVLQPGESATVTLMISVPVGAPAGAQDITTLTATSSQDSGVSDTAVDTTEVISQVYGLLFEPDNLRVVSSPATVVYTHTLTNTGSGLDSYSFAATSSQGWGVAVPPTLTLAAAATATVNVTLTVPISSAGLVDFMAVTATSVSDPTVVATVTNTTVVSGLQGTAAVVIEPDWLRSAVAGQIVQYTHTVTNTGTFTDSYSLSVASSLTWTVSVAPTNLFSVAPNETRAVQVTVNVPGGAPVGTTDMTTVTVSSLTVLTATDTAVDTTQVVSQTYSLLFEPDNTQTVASPATVVYTHTLTNTGNGPDTYDFVATSSQGWAVDVPPSLSLAAAEAATVMVTLTVPISSDGLTDVMTVTAVSVNDPTAVATVTNTTIVTSTPGVAAVVIEPDWARIALAGQIVIYTHTVTNTGAFTDDYSLDVASSLTWTVSVTPNSLVNVAPAESRPVTVTVNVPGGAPVGTTDMTTVTVSSLTVLTATDTAVDTTQVVSQTYSLLFEPDNTQTVASPATVVYTHTLTNTGNGPDTYDFTATSSQGWGVAVPPSVSLASGSAATVMVTLTVPISSDGLTDVMTVTAVSINDPTAVATVTNTTIVTSEQDIVSVVIEPDWTRMAVAGQVVLYAHTVTNTGTVTDDYSLTAVSSLTWTVSVAPSSLLNVGAGESRAVTVSVAVPAGAPIGTTDMTTVTVASQTVMTATDTAVDTTQVVEQVRDVQFEPNRTMTTTANSTITYTHFLTNTGNGPDTYVVAAVSDHGWATQASPSPVSLDAGEATTVTVSLVVPLAGSGLTDTMLVQATSVWNTVVSATVTDTTIVLGSPVTLSVVIEPNNVAAGLPGGVMVYNHTVTNTGMVADDFSLQAVSGQGWFVTVSPSSVSLAANESAPVTVTVAIPGTAVNGEQDITTVKAASFTDDRVFDEARDITNVIIQPANPTIYLPFITKPVIQPPTPTPTATPVTPPPTVTPVPPTATPIPCTTTGVDLIVTEIEIVPNPPVAGQPATIFVTIRNRGSVDVAYGNNFFVDFYVDQVPAPVTAGIRYAGIQGSDMTAGTSHTYRMNQPSSTYSFSGGTHQVYAQVDTDNTVNECPREDNNVLGPISISVSGSGQGDGNEAPGIQLEPGPRVTPTPDLSLSGGVAAPAVPVATATPMLVPVQKP